VTTLRKLLSSLKRRLGFHADGMDFKERIIAVGHLLTGNLFGSLIGFATFVVTARSLGPTEFGILALVYAFARAIERLISFQTWQPLIRYGAGLVENRDHEKLRSLLKFGMLLDIGAAIAAWAVAITVALTASAYMEWSERTVQLTLIYSTALLFRLSGMPTAVMRLFGKFRTIAYGQVGIGLFRLAFCSLGAYLGLSLTYFITIWMLAQAIGGISLFVLAFLTLRKLGITGLFRAPLKGITSHFPDLWNFAITSNISLTVRASANELDTLMVGAFAGPQAAGLYHIAKRIGRLAQQIAVQMQAVLYPDVARLWALQAVEKFKRAVYQFEFLLFGLGLIGTVAAYFLAEPILRLSVGNEFAAAAPLLVVQCIAVTLNLTGSSMRSALLAMGRQRRELGIVLMATAAFHATALVLIPQLGPMGANFGHVAFGAIWLTGLSIAFRRSLLGKELPEDMSQKPPEKSPIDVDDIQ
jgi:O-antigen/teichoic acid export membrane protein